MSMCGIVTVILWVDCTGLCECNYIECNIVLCLYFSYVIFIITLYIRIHILNIINYISNCNFVPFLYFQYVMSTIALYIHLQILKCILSIYYVTYPYIQLQILKCIECIINCSNVPYLYFPHVLSLHNP
jgi:hypothetical protein